MHMTLSEILKEFNNKDFRVIEYRKVYNTDSGETESLVGMAQYKNKMLMSLDGDSYHLSDKLSRYELYEDDWLVVWL